MKIINLWLVSPNSVYEIELLRYTPARDSIKVSRATTDYEVTIYNRILAALYPIPETK